MEKKNEFYYVFKTRRYKGMRLEQVFLKDPLYVAKIYSDQLCRKPRGNGRIRNELQLAVDSLKMKLEKLELIQTCPFCEKKKVEYFLVPSVGKMNSGLVACDSLACQRELQARREGSYFKLSEILVIIPYLNKKDVDVVIKIFRNAHNWDLLSELC